MLDQNIIESSDINDLEEIYASQQQQQKKKEVSQTGQNFGDVAEVIEHKPKKPQPQIPVTPQLTSTPDPAQPPAPSPDLIPELVVEVKVEPEVISGFPVNPSHPVIHPKVVAPKSIDQFILDTAEQMKQFKVQKAEDEKIEFINNSYKKIFAALTGEPVATPAPQPKVVYREPEKTPEAPVSSKQSNPKRSWSFKTIMLFSSMTAILLIAVTYIIVSLV